jgi:hypothetical protein
MKVTDISRGIKAEMPQEKMWKFGHFDKVFPVRVYKDPDNPNKYKKVPLTEHGFKDASSDPEQIAAWEKQFPGASWGFPTSSELFMLDPDKISGGLESWAELVAIHGEPDTYTVRTIGGGKHYWFRPVAGLKITNSTSKFAPGIDVRGEGGYAVIPPSAGYEVVNDAEPMIAPMWIVRRLLNMNNPMQTNQQLRERFSLPERIVDGQRNDILFRYGSSLRAKGADEDEIRQELFDVRDTRFERPETFSDEEVETIIAQVLRYEKGVSKVANADDDHTPAGYLHALNSLGYHFSLNIMDDSIYINGVKMDDINKDTMLFELGNLGYDSEKKAEKAWKFEADQNRFHPVADYLKSLKWDGQDHIGKMASYFKDREGKFPLYVRKWLIGAVAKVLPVQRGVQNRMLVLAGTQGLGKSKWIEWLVQDLTDFYIAKDIKPASNDDHLRKMRKWVWEVPEVSSTTRKAEAEELKHFLSGEWVTARTPYGHFDLHKPALANFIGTDNPEGVGFLSDSTGSRRYMISTIESIDWRGYTANVDVKQVWAQAVALVEAGEDWNLNEEEAKEAAAINEQFEMEDSLEQYLYKYFIIDPEHPEYVMATSEIVDILRLQEDFSVSDRSLQNRIAKILTKKGLKKDKFTPVGFSGRVNGWFGIRRNDDPAVLWKDNRTGF